MTPVCDITLGGASTVRWLCVRHQSDRRGDGWSVRPNGKGAPWPCDDCVTAAQLAPGYTTPTVRFVATMPESRLPTESECPRPAEPMSWAQRISLLSATQDAVKARLAG